MMDHDEVPLDSGDVDIPQMCAGIAQGGIRWANHS